MDPVALLKLASQTIQQDLAASVNWQDDAALEAKQHLEKLSAALEEAQTQLADATARMNAAQSQAQARLAEVRGQASAVQAKAAAAKGAIADAAAETGAVPFEEAQGVGAAHMQHVIHILLHGSEPPAEEPLRDLESVAEMWTDPEAAQRSEAIKAPKPAPPAAKKPPAADKPDDVGKDIWEDLE